MGALRDSLFGVGQLKKRNGSALAYPSLGGPNSYVDLISNSQLHSAMQFTRASGGTTEISPGALTTAAVNEPRYGWFNGRRGLLIEPAATNLVRNSNTFGAATWDKGMNTPVQSPTPDGTQFVSASNSFSYVSTSVTVTPGVPVTLSWRIRRIGAIGVRAGSGLANDGTGGAAAFSAANALISKITTEWQVISCTATPTTPIITLHAVPYDAQGTTYEVSWVQAEQAGVNTSPILTGGSPATRAPDVPTIATAAFGFNPNEGTFVFDTVMPQNNCVTFSLDNGTPVFIEQYAELGKLQVATSGGGARSGNQLIAAGVPIKAVISYTQTTIDTALNGVIGNQGQNTAALSLVTMLRIGRNRIENAYLGGPIFSLRYYPRNFTEVERKAVSI